MAQISLAVSIVCFSTYLHRTLRYKIRYNYILSVLTDRSASAVPWPRLAGASPSDGSRVPPLTDVRTPPPLQLQARQLSGLVETARQNCTELERKLQAVTLYREMAQLERQLNTLLDTLNGTDQREAVVVRASVDGQRDGKGPRTLMGGGDGPGDRG